MVTPKIIRNLLMFVPKIRLVFDYRISDSISLLVNISYINLCIIGDINYSNNVLIQTKSIRYVQYKYLYKKQLIYRQNF